MGMADERTPVAAYVDGSPAEESSLVSRRSIAQVTAWK